MSGPSHVRRYVGLAGGTVVFAAGAAATVIAERQRISRRRAGALQPFGSLRGDRHVVIADDGVDLHAEIDEIAPHAETDPHAEAEIAPHAAAGPVTPATIVFVHGYALNLDCWYYQRTALRGQQRLVFYDQRSHGRSGRSRPENCTFDQLGRDLAAVIEQLAAERPVILVGHSMGGMTIMSLAEQHPEWFGEQIVGVALISTSAAGVNAETLGMPGAAGRFLHRVTPAVVATLARAPKLVERGRRASSEVALALTRRLAFGRSVPDEVVDFTDQMLAATPFDVVADFFPGFDEHDKRDALPVLRGIPSVVVCGTADAITSIENCRAITAIVPTATLVEVADAGHMVILERPGEVTDALEDLVAAVRSGRGAAPPAASGRRTRGPRSARRSAS